MMNKINNKYIKEILPYIFLILILIFIKSFIVSPIKVNGDSMYSTLHDGDLMILNKTIYHFTDIRRFDIVVIKTKKSFIIKRVIGLPGDKVEYKNNRLYVNDSEVEEDYIRGKMEDYNIEELGSTVVPANSYFVLGDNRKVSADSRVYGFIKQKDILGRAKTTIFPFNRIGIK